MTRHQRRKLARKRKDAKAVILKSRAMRVLQEETEKRNLAAPRARRTEPGLVSSIYSGAANPMGYTRGDGYTKANAPEGCEMALAKDPWRD